MDFDYPFGRKYAPHRGPNTGRLTASQSNATLMVEEAVRGLPADKAVVAVFEALRSHPDISADDLDRLGNQFCRAAHEALRHG